MSATPSTTPKTQRLTDLDDKQKAAIASMTKPSDLDYSERKRQYSSLRRAILKDASPALVAKFQMANDNERFFDYIMCFSICGYKKKSKTHASRNLVIKYDQTSKLRSISYGKQNTIIDVVNTSGFRCWSHGWSIQIFQIFTSKRSTSRTSSSCALTGMSRRHSWTMWLGFGKHVQVKTTSNHFG